MSGDTITRWAPRLRPATLVWIAVGVAWLAYGACGLVACENPWLGPLVTLTIACGAAASAVAPAVRARLAGRRALAVGLRLASVALCGVAGFALLELPYNVWLAQMRPELVALNLKLVGSAALCIWLLFARRRSALVGFSAACLLFGLANYFLCLFKEQTVLPADVLALGTAAEVGGGYTYVLHDGPVAALALFFAYAAAVSLVPNGRLTRLTGAAGLVAGLALAAGLVSWYATHDLKEDYGVAVDVWATRDSYMEFGSVPSFLQRMQEVEPEVPQGYSTQGAAELQAGLAAAWDAAHPGYPQTLAQARAYQRDLTGSDELPCVVAVMNESFADLSRYPGVEGYGGIPAFDAIDAQLRGLVYTSVRGGGTCNSEFEYLTGASLASLGGGVYPYMFYDLGGVESLPAILGSLGYRTVAVHPAAASNWRRDMVYRSLGFDVFLSEADFGEEAETLRGLITDGATYGKVLELLGGDGEGAIGADDAPWFVFDVTLQNHGGYTTGLLDAYPYAGATVNGARIDEMAEYLSCVDASVEDLLAFIDELEKLDRKVVLVFFGDHQPGFNDQVAEAAYGVPVADLNQDQVQQRFVTPYLVWANYDLGLGALGIAASAQLTADTSLNYLMATTMFAAGLPLTEYQKALLQLSAEMPALNLNGYRDAYGAWYWVGEDGPARDVYEAYAILQYADLFDANGDAAYASYGEQVLADAGEPVCAAGGEAA